MSNNPQRNRFVGLSLTKLTATFVALFQTFFGLLSVVAMEGAPSDQQIVMTTLIFGSAIALFLCWRSRRIAAWGAIVFALGLGVSGTIYNYTLLEPVLLIGLISLAGPGLLAGLLLLAGSYSEHEDNIHLLKPPPKRIVYFFVIGSVVVLLIISWILGLNI